MILKFIPPNRDQQYLFPPSIKDWLPERHLAQFIVDIVSQLDLRPIAETYAGKGFKAYHPDHDTIAAFRKRFLEQLNPLFVEILMLAREMGLLKLGKVSLDGNHKQNIPRSNFPAISKLHNGHIDNHLFSC
jgi:transposase